jgi:hypothetical protein
VNATILIPSHGHAILTRPENGRKSVLEPKTCDAANGMWVITHRHNKPTFTTRVDWSEFGVWGFPTFGPVYRGTGPIVTVAPSEADGGVKPNGRPYVDPRLAGVLKRAAKKVVTAKKRAPRARAKG